MGFHSSVPASGICKETEIIQKVTSNKETNKFLSRISEATCKEALEEMLSPAVPSSRVEQAIRTGFLESRDSSPKHVVINWLNLYRLGWPLLICGGLSNCHYTAKENWTGIEITWIS